MQISTTKQLPKPSKAGKQTVKNVQRLVVFVNDKKTPLGTKLLGAQLDRIKQHIAISDFKGGLNEITTDICVLDAGKREIQLQLVGIGNRKKLKATDIQKLAQTIYAANKKRVVNLTLAIADIFTKQELGQFLLALLNASYRFDKYKSKQQATPLLNKVSLLTDVNYKAEIDFAQAVFTGQSLTRDVANEPGNICHPEFMAEQALALEAKYPDLLKVTVINQKKIAKMGMNCFLSVSKGSDREGKLVILEYYGKSKFPNLAKTPDAESDKSVDAPIALVGKGVTFDSGGISIKPGAGMEEMKFDMGGSASVIGTMKALCEARLAVNVVAALACAENMPSARASRPGDVVTAMNGTTVEILNTDAEGRLVLSDTLCYIKRYAPKVIIDVATLTGACVIALGSVRSAVYSTDDTLLANLQTASEQAGDAVWHMPLDDEYQSQLDSPIADLQNIGGRAGGSITAACFLSRFVDEGQAWAHLDIAGTAWISGAKRNATGRPVPLFMQYLKNCAEQA